MQHEPSTSVVVYDPVFGDSERLALLPVRRSNIQSYARTLWQQSWRVYFQRK